MHNEHVSQLASGNLQLLTHWINFTNSVVGAERHSTARQVQSTLQRYKTPDIIMLHLDELSGRR